MKALIPIALMLAIAACTKQSETKDEFRSAIDQYVMEHAGDPGSYEFIDIDTIDSLRTYRYDPYVKDWSTRILNLVGKAKELNIYLEYDVFEKYQDTLTLLQDSVIKYMGEHGGLICGYAVIAKYRIKNEFNAQILRTDTFYFQMDKTLVAMNDTTGVNYKLFASIENHATGN